MATSEAAEQQSPANGAAAASPDVAAPAQADQSAGLGDIIVTARKQSESIMKVPVATSALGGKDLDRLHVTDVRDISTQVPAINFDKAMGGGGGSLSIRGIGSSALDTGIEQAVSTVIDGLQTSRGNFISAGLFDLEQVEVLKGPQALFFGKNSPGGVLSLTSAAPTQEFTAYFRTGYEFRANERYAEGAVSGPITETLTGRVAVRGDKMRGWVRNVSEDGPNPFAAIPGQAATIGSRPYSSNASSELIARGTLKWEPASNFTATLRGLYDQLHNNGSQAESETSYCGTNSSSDTYGVIDPTGDCTINNRQSVGRVPPGAAASDPVFRDGRPYGRFSTYLASLTMDYITGPIDITSVTGYLNYRRRTIVAQPTSYIYATPGGDEHFHQFSQELRVVTSYDSPINFSGGLYYEATRLTDHYPGLTVPLPPDATTGNYLTYIYDSAQTGKSYSAFGQLRWKIVPTLEFDAGVRYSHDSRKASVQNSFVNSNTVGVLPLKPAGVVLAGKKSFDNFSPELTLSWTPIDRTMFYGSYKVGFKAGGGTSAAILPASTTTDDLFYDPEHIKGFEIGAKSLLLGGKLRLTAAAYTYKYTDLQISNFDASTFSIQSLNVGGLRTKGAEVGATYQVLDGLTITGGLAYTRARYTSFAGIACYSGQTAATGCVGSAQDLTGERKYRSPDWSGNAGFTYETPVGEDFKLLASGSMKFSSSYFTQENNSPFAVQKAYQQYDATVSFGRQDDRWQVSLIGRNLSDKQYVGSSYDQPGAVLQPTITSVVARPRQITLQLSVRY